MGPGVKQAKWLALAALMASLVWAPGAASAQVVVTSDSNLTFGLLTPGVPAPVLPTDPQGAQFTIEARKGTFSLTFNMPSHLTGPNGAQIPLLFGAADGVAEYRNGVVVFDPADGVEIQTNPGHPIATVNLGGAALPATGQVAGSYSATIVMMIVQTGT